MDLDPLDIGPFQWLLLVHDRSAVIVDDHHFFAILAEVDHRVIRGIGGKRQLEPNLDLDVDSFDLFAFAVLIFRCLQLHHHKLIGYVLHDHCLDDMIHRTGELGVFEAVLGM